MLRFMNFLATFAMLGLVNLVPSKTQAAEDVARGKYLVSVAGCNDCHTPGYFFGKPDSSRYLGGSEVGFEIPGLGIFHGPNLTPDKETGLGSWSNDQIVTALTTGKRPDGRELAGVMPWRAFANFTRDDLNSIVAYLRTLPPVHNKVAGPYDSSEQSTAFVLKIVPGGQKK
jgi:mono/diheme cytochrome c family protein